MAKMRKYKFWNENGDEKEVEKMSFKTAVKSIQEDYKDQLLDVEYITKKGKKMLNLFNTIRQSLLQEQRRLEKRN